jgi:RNA polymerase sigma-70 factor (ECF subfamily)
MTPRGVSSRPDEDLIRAAVEGNTSAFNALVRKHEDTVYGFAFKVCRDREKAQEALQDTFITMFRKLGTFDGRSKFSTWLYTIVSNNCLMKRRRRKIDDLLESLDEPPPQSGRTRSYRFAEWVETPVDLLLTRELRSVLERSLKRLPVDYRVVFVLRDMEGKSAAEAAAILKISEEAVKSRLRRARAFLRAQLTPYMSRGKE